MAVATELRLDPSARLPGHQFPLGAMQSALQMVRSGTSLQATARILSWLLPQLGWGTRTPCYLTVRQWLLRFGLHALTGPRQRSDDWVWFVDHTQQLGDKKILLILGLRLATWQIGRPLEHGDVELLALHPENTSNGESLRRHLEALTLRLGPPRAIVSDGARDLRLGVTLFRAAHPERSIAWLYDIKHFSAVLLKRELENDSTWQAFTAAANRTKQQCSVTALAALNPPNQRGKARYLNLQELLAWAGKILALLDHSSGLAELQLDAAKCAAKFGWLREFRPAIADWQAALQVVEITESHVRRQGVYLGFIADLQPRLEIAATSPMSQRLRDQLLLHLAEQAEQTTAEEHLPASSEVLESLIGTYKHLQGEQGHHGVTSLVLGLGTLLTTDLAPSLPAAFTEVSTRDVVNWCRENLGQTLQGCRQRLHQFLSRTTKPDPQPPPS